MSFESFTEPENAAAVWSAVAATFAALAAFLSWRAQITTLRHSFRPDIVVAGWSRHEGTDSQPEQLCFSVIKNAGRDSARQVLVNAAGKADDGRQTYVAGTVNIASLSAGEEVNVDGSIFLMWRHVRKSGPLGKLLPIQIKVLSWDALAVRHATTISLIAMESPDSQLGNSFRVAPGIYLTSQITQSVPVWRLKVRHTLQRVPILRGLVGSDT